MENYKSTAMMTAEETPPPCPLCVARARRVQIQELRTSGLTFREIGEKFDISRQNAHRAWKKRTPAPRGPAKEE